MGSVSHLGYLADRRGRKPNPFPAPILFGAIAMLIFAAVAIVFGQTTGIGLVQSQLGAPAAIRDISLQRHSDDRVVVIDAVTGAQIASYGAMEGGFVRGSLRAFERMRQVAGIPIEAPYRLIRWDTGRVSLSDTKTGERIYLEAFGRDNAAAFGALLDTQGGAAR